MEMPTLDGFVYAIYSTAPKFPHGHEILRLQLCASEKDEVKYALVVDLENFDIYRAVKGEEATLNSEKLERNTCSPLL